MTLQVSMTESQIIYLNELFITGLNSTNVCSTLLRGNPFYVILTHFKDVSVAMMNLSAPDSLAESTNWITCLALFPPPHFGTLSKIQKGGKPVPRPVEDHQCLQRSVKTNETDTLTCLHVCCAVSCACVRVYRVSQLILVTHTVTMASNLVRFSYLKLGSHGTNQNKSY